VPHLGEAFLGQAAQLVGNVEVAEEGVPGEGGGLRLVASHGHSTVEHVGRLLALCTPM